MLKSIHVMAHHKPQPIASHAENSVEVHDHGISVNNAHSNYSKLGGMIVCLILGRFQPRLLQNMFVKIISNRILYGDNGGCGNTNHTEAVIHPYSRLYKDLAIASWKARPLYRDVSRRRFCISLFNGNIIARIKVWFTTIFCARIAVLIIAWDKPPYFVAEVCSNSRHVSACEYLTSSSRLLQVVSICCGRNRIIHWLTFVAILVERKISPVS